MRVAVLGLGEAGSRLAADLVDAGDDVCGYDPAPMAAIPGVDDYESAEKAITGCTLALAVTHASQARTLLESVAASLHGGLIYADLSTGSPGLKKELADRAGRRGARFVDVALMAPVPGQGLATPALASGDGATQYAALINARGGRVEVIGEEPGAAATRKLLRSVVMKGLAGLLIESTEAAARYNQDQWFWNHLVEQLGAIDQDLMERLLYATPAHAGRRLEEMEAARDLLIEAGVPATMTEATIALLRRFA